MRLKGWRISLFFAPVAAAAVYFSTESELISSQRSEKTEILTLKVDQGAQIHELYRAGYDVTGIDFGKNLVDVYVDENSKQLLLGQYKNLKVVNSNAIDRTLAPDANYTNPDELKEFLDSLAAKAPEISRLEVIGQSIQGRDILALKITDNPDTRELDEPTILFNAMHHSREVMTTEVTMDIAEYLIDNYGVDEKVTHWVNNTEIWVLPMLNPDGNNRVWNQDKMWRKNVRGGYGVDINRNYPYKWGACRGSSGFSFMQDYRGPSAASEPETQNLMNLVARTQPVFNISYHSYSELVIYPLGCEGQRAANKEVVEGIGQQLAQKLPSDDGDSHYRPGTAWELIYAVDGSDIDWMYAEHHVVPYVIELNARRLGFHPDYRWRQPTVEKQRAGWGFLLDRLTQSGIRGVVRDDSGQVLTDGTVTFTKVGSATASASTYRLKKDGTYHIVLKPGSYKLTFNATGRSITKEILVGDDLVVQDIEI